MMIGMLFPGAPRYPGGVLVGILILWGCEPQPIAVPLPEIQTGEEKGQGGPTSSVFDAMNTAIQDEYHAHFTYAGVLATLDADVSPFNNIVLAEAQHVTSIAGLFLSRGWPVPESDWDLENVPVFSTRVAACIGGAEAEIHNIAMYDELLLVDLPLDVEEVFLHVQEASQIHHLPAFEACSLPGPLEAMELAIQDEYLAHATYAKVLADLGDIAPFDAIVIAESQHVSSIAALFTKRGLPVPVSLWDETTVGSFPSRPKACAGGVAAEELNIAMYDELLLLDLPDDVGMVFENLRTASLDHHLPAFISCAPAGLGSASF